MLFSHLFEREVADTKVGDDPLAETETGGNTPPPVTVTTMCGDVDTESTSETRHNKARFPGRREVRTHEEIEYTA